MVNCTCKSSVPLRLCVLQKEEITRHKQVKNLLPSILVTFRWKRKSGNGYILAQICITVKRQRFGKTVADSRFRPTCPKHPEKRRRTSARAYLRIGRCAGEFRQTFRSASSDVQDRCSRRSQSGEVCICPHATLKCIIIQPICMIMQNKPRENCVYERIFSFAQKKQ